MLDTNTKRRIDTARDILVGKVPDPKSQVEQITIALIYKFMDDMDAESEEFGGERRFFSNGYSKYSWAKLMRSGLGGYDTLNLYAEAIAKMQENPAIPVLFRSIFKNAYLPYRDPETLKSFLKVIDEFEYDHSERLGDAFEYLLSVLGSQGDAGQFRTPRHIIDFMVKIIDPKKHEKILDPACGTAGFLISSFKHIWDANKETPLTPDEMGTLAANINGYDISPDMVRLSLVNMYLHGFNDPHIEEYDTLSSQDKWNEYADVILANPPFMSPKGGIKPHKRFSVKSKRSEVLFVDYMHEHLTPHGRAAIIVPEGIIFQSGKAYKQLRKMLVENSLVAVVSLPAGVFQPYSGVKTSILILDKSLAKQSQHIGFFKVENDGFGLGAQRRPIEKNDLPMVNEEVEKFLQALRDRNDFEELVLSTGHAVLKEMVAENGDFNLSGERYRSNEKKESPFLFVKVGELFKKSGETVMPETLKGPVTYIGLENIKQNTGELSGSFITRNTADIKSLKNVFKTGDILYGKLRPNLNKVWLANQTGICSTDIFVISPEEERVLSPLYAYVFRSSRFNDMVMSKIKGAQLPRIGWESFKDLEIPQPPLEVQQEIVAEIEGYQKIIDGARAVIDNYNPQILIDPEWEMVELEKICQINPNTINPQTAYPEKTINYIDIASVENETGRFLGYNEIKSDDAPSRARREVKAGDVLLSTVRPNLKAFTLLKELKPRSVASTGFAVLRSKSEVVDPKFLLSAIFGRNVVDQMIGMMGKGAYPSINQKDVASVKIPLPPLETQKAIVAEIEAEQTLVNANCELIERFEKKIMAIIARVWGEENNESEL